MEFNNEREVKKNVRDDHLHNSQYVALTISDQQFRHNSNDFSIVGNYHRITAAEAMNIPSTVKVMEKLLVTV